MRIIINKKNQKGFSILAVILVIVAVIVAIGVWALSGQTNNGNTGNNTSDIQAASIINDSGAIKLAFDTLIINGSSPSSIVFVPNTASTSTAPNMLDPTTGIQVPKVNANAVKPSSSSEGFYVYNAANFKGNGIGLNANTDSTILLSGVKDSVCMRINNILYGTPSIPATSIITGSVATSGATTAAPTTTIALDLTTYPALLGWGAGCFSTSVGGTDDNVFFRILKAN